VYRSGVVMSDEELSHLLKVCQRLSTDLQVFGDVGRLMWLEANSVARGVERIIEARADRGSVF
jgi:hypothetical protein